MKFSELKELYNKYSSMSVTISGETETLKNLLSRDGTQATLTHKGIIKFSSPDFKESISIDLNTLEL